MLVILIFLSILFTFFVILFLSIVASKKFLALLAIILNPILGLLQMFLWWGFITLTNYHLYLIFRTKNVFKAQKYLNRLYLCLFRYKKIIKPVYDKKIKDDILIFSNDNYVLQGSTSIQVMFKDNYRSFNDLDFISVISRDLELSSLVLAKISGVNGNKMLSKFKINDIAVDLLNIKLIPYKFVKRLDSDILVPNFHWMISMKFVQIFKLTQLYKSNKDRLDYQEKLNNSILDLSYLISKKNYCWQTLYKNIETLTISNSFITLLTNEKQQYDFYNKTQQNNFNFALQNLYSQNCPNEEALFFLKSLQNKLLRNNKYKLLNNQIKTTLNAFNKIIEHLININVITNLSLNTFFIDVNDKKLNKYISSWNLNRKFKNIDNLLMCFSKHENKIDIRELYLLELYKGLNYVKK
ncbi:MAG4530 family protein [Mycoplasmopsis felifaucium]|uniref:MAG4530 family protein n=1 Tax=Mycoplasmopsis felifaucium TaxID=35768 RepID=UPI0038CDC0D3